MCLHESKGDNSTTTKPSERLLKWALPPIIKNIKIVKSFSTNHMKQNTPIDISKLPFPSYHNNNDSYSQLQSNSSNFISVYLDKLLLRKSESFMNQQSCRYSTIESKTPIISSVRSSNNNCFNRRIEAYKNKQSNNKGRNNNSNYNGHKVEYTFLTDMLERIRHRVSFISFKNKELYEKEVENIVNEELTHLHFNNPNKHKTNQCNRSNFTSYGVELNPMRMFPSHSNASNYEEIVSYKKSIKHMPQGNCASGWGTNRNTQLRHLLLNEPSILSFLMNNPTKESFFSMMIKQDKAPQINSSRIKHQRRTSRNNNLIMNSNSTVKHIKKSKCSSVGRTTNDSSTVILKDNYNNKSNVTLNPITEPNNSGKRHSKSTTHSKATKRFIKELPSMLFHTITECTNTTGDDMKNIIKPTQRYLKRTTIKQRTVKNKEDNDYIKEESVLLKQKEKELTKIIERNTMVRKLINIGRVKARRGVDVILLNAAHRHKFKSNRNHLLDKSSSVSEIKTILSNSARNINDKYSPVKPEEEEEQIEFIKPIYHKRRSNKKSSTVVVNNHNIGNRKFRLSFINSGDNTITGSGNTNIDYNTLIEQRKQRRTKTFFDDKGKEKRKRRLSELLNEYKEQKEHKEQYKEQYNVQRKSLTKQKDNKLSKVTLRRDKHKLNITKDNKHTKKNIKSIEHKKQENEHVELYQSIKLSEKDVITNNKDSTSKPEQPVREIRKLKRLIRSDNTQILSALNSTEFKSPSPTHTILQLRNMNILPKRTYRLKKDSNSNQPVQNQQHDTPKMNSNTVEERTHFFKDLDTNEEVEKRKQVLLMKIGNDITYGISKGELGEKEQMLFNKFREQITSLKVTDDEEYVDYLEENFYLFQKEMEDLKRQREIEKRINGFMFHLRGGLDNEKGNKEFLKNKARVVSAKSVFVSSNPFDDITDNE